VDLTLILATKKVDDKSLWVYNTCID
jgi:hypothetical protein